MGRSTSPPAAAPLEAQHQERRRPVPEQRQAAMPRSAAAAGVFAGSPYGPGPHASPGAPAPAPRRRRVALGLAAVVMVVVVAWDSTAMAVNALISQDLPVLTQIAATEAAAYIELGAILTEVSAVAATVKEHTTLAKTAWGAVQELRHLSRQELRDLALAGVHRAFPQLSQIYGDIRDIGDLDYRDQRAMMTLRGILFEEVYGPAIDAMHGGHENLEALSKAEEQQGRAQAKVDARRAEATSWAEDCRRTAGQGEGACQAAASRAAVQQALLLADIQETQLHSVELQQRMLAEEERQDADSIYAFDRWVSDLETYLRGNGRNAEEPCPPGRCLHAKYGRKMHERIAEFQARHPQLVGSSRRRGS